MTATICLLTCALALGQVRDRGDWQLTPQLAPGLELVYSGTYAEESLIPNVQFQRHYRLETILFVLDGERGPWDVAVMTALSLNDGRQAVVQAVHQVSPGSVRLETARVDGQGRLRSADNKPLLLNMLGPATLETGCLVEAPLARVGKSHTWEVAEEGRPPRTWAVAGNELVNGVTCLKLVGEQQSDDWDRPRGTTTAWRRKDVVWLTPQLNVAQKVERVIERRDPARRTPTQRATVRYELESRLRYPGRLFDDRRREILAARKFIDDSAVMLRQPAQHRPRLDDMIRRVSTHIEQQPETPYRRALLHLKQGLEAARRGEAPVPNEPETPAAAIRPAEPGQAVADFVVSSLTDKQSVRLQRLLGRPTLVVFYNPSSGIGRETMLFAKGLMEKNDGRLNVMAMAVTNNVELARKQHGELKLPFPVLDGHGLRLTFGVADTPRLVLLDSEGVVRCAHTGWGYHVPEEIARELSLCVKNK